MLNLSKAGVTGSPSSRSRSPCRKNSSQARCDHKRDTLHGLHQIDYSVLEHIGGMDAYPEEALL